MAFPQQAKNEALATIDSALTILNKFPDLDQTSTYLSHDITANPFPFLMDLFKSTAGYNVFINILSKIMLIAIPPMEIAVKTVLLTNIKNMLSCSINPFISDELLKNGIVFSLDQIDLLDILKKSPSDKVGQYYYFDNKNKPQMVTETIKVPDENGIEHDEVVTKKVRSFKTDEELRDSSDFNCLLWYMKNKAYTREVWGKKITDNNSWVKDSDYWNENKNKCRKGAGIVTLEFHARSQNITNAEGEGMGVQTPLNNLIHVFIGNTQEQDINTIRNNEEKINEKSKELDKINKNIQKIEHDIEALKEEKKLTKEYFKLKKINKEEYENTIDLIERKIKFLKSEDNNSNLSKLKGDLSSALNDKVGAIKDLVKTKKSKLSTGNYRNIEQNYYYRRTLIEFNTDYVMSMRLFDAKVLTAQMIDTLVGFASADINISFKSELIKDEIKKMVQMVVETDDTVVDDCFFTFTNDDYNRMMEKAELNRANLFSVNGETNTSLQIDPSEILSSLNELDEDAIADGNTTIIEHALNEISATLSETKESRKTSFNFGIKSNFIENLMNNLAYAIVYSVISPKIYLLILVNLKILGNEVNFSLEQFIGQYKQLLVSLIREIRDILLKYLLEELYKIVGNIATELAIKIGVEQMSYYQRLIKRIFDCIKFGKGKGLDWQMDDVDYADIVSEEKTEENKPNSSC